MKTTSHAQRLRKASLNILKYFIINNGDVPIFGYVSPIEYGQANVFKLNRPKNCGNLRTLDNWLLTKSQLLGNFWLYLIRLNGPFERLLNSQVPFNRMTASRPESFSKSFMQLKEMNFSLLTLLDMSIHHNVFWFSNTYKRSLPICKLALLLLIGETFLSPVVAHNTNQPNTIDAHFLQTIR